jgi:hypothetical protein
MFTAVLWFPSRCHMAGSLCYATVPCREPSHAWRCVSSSPALLDSVMARSALIRCCDDLAFLSRRPHRNVQESHTDSQTANQPRQPYAASSPLGNRCQRLERQWHAGSVQVGLAVNATIRRHALFSPLHKVVSFSSCDVTRSWALQTPEYQSMSKYGFCAYGCSFEVASQSILNGPGEVSPLSRNWPGTRVGSLAPLI